MTAQDKRLYTAGVMRVIWTPAANRQLVTLTAAQARVAASRSGHVIMIVRRVAGERAHLILQDGSVAGPRSPDAVRRLYQRFQRLERDCAQMQIVVAAPAWIPLFPSNWFSDRAVSTRLDFEFS